MVVGGTCGGAWLIDVVSMVGVVAGWYGSGRCDGGVWCLVW